MWYLLRLLLSFNDTFCETRIVSFSESLPERGYNHFQTYDNSKMVLLHF
jgi:hypothetical protein